MQGVEAQTLANVYIALESDLEIIPVINKIDLPGSAALAPLSAVRSVQHAPARLRLALESPREADSWPDDGPAATDWHSTAGADVEKVKREVEEVVGIDCSNAILTSAKQGIGIEDVLEAVVKRIPPPPDNTHKPLRALIFDSYYDAYKAMPSSLFCGPSTSAGRGLCHQSVP